MALDSGGSVLLLMMQSHFLKLNDDKTELLLVHSKYRQIMPLLPVVTLIISHSKISTKRTVKQAMGENPKQELLP